MLMVDVVDIMDEDGSSLTVELEAVFEILDNVSSSLLASNAITGLLVAFDVASEINFGDSIFSVSSLRSLVSQFLRVTCPELLLGISSFTSRV